MKFTALLALLGATTQAVSQKELAATRLEAHKALAELLAEIDNQAMVMSESSSGSSSEGSSSGSSESEGSGSSSGDDDMDIDEDDLEEALEEEGLAQKPRFRGRRHHRRGNNDAALVNKRNRLEREDGLFEQKVGKNEEVISKIDQKLTQDAKRKGTQVYRQFEALKKKVNQGTAKK